MNIGAVLNLGRMHAEALMEDECRIERPGPEVMDPVTGVVTPPRILVAETKCKVQDAAGDTVTETAGATYTIQAERLDIPVDVPGVRVGDVATIIKTKHAPHLVGVMFRVTRLFDKTHATAQRLPVERISSWEK